MLKIAMLLCAAMLAVALADLPYGYYQMLRIVTTGTLIWLLVSVWEEATAVEKVLLALFAISYNPLFKIHMERELHAIVNVLTILLIAVVFWRHKQIVERV